jgi:hypothetical protein
MYSSKGMAALSRVVELRIVVNDARSLEAPAHSALGRFGTGAEVALRPERKKRSLSSRVYSSQVRRKAAR